MKAFPTSTWGRAGIAVILGFTLGILALPWLSLPLKTVRAHLTPTFVNGLKILVAVVGVLVLSSRAWQWPEGRRETYRHVRDALLLALGILAALLWWNLGKFRFDSYIHAWDTYHYYTGAKYFRELGYTRLYLCSTVADIEDGIVPADSSRYMRDLETNALRRVPGIMVDRASCVQHFSAERWAAFKADIAWFRLRMGPKLWERALGDHGYNGTPVWAILGTTLSQTGPASDSQILVLTLIDPVLLLVMWGAVMSAFGWRATCVALLFWGTNYPANSGWIAGSYLRQDWLAASVIGICLLRVGRPMAAGFALTTAGLLRVFPGLLIGGLLLKAGWNIWERRGLYLSSDLRRFAVGCLASMFLLLPVSTMVAGRLSAWPEFLANAHKHWNTPLTNYMGLKTVLAYDHDTRAAVTAAEPLEDDPFAVWKAARQRVFAERWPIFVALVGAFMGLLAWAVRRQPDWVAAVLGIGIIPFGTELTCYYYSILLAYGLLWERRVVVATGLSLLAALSWAGPSIFSRSDQVYPLLSVLVIAFVAFATSSIPPDRKLVPSGDKAASAT